MKVCWVRLSPKRVWHRVVHPQLEVAMCGVDISKVGLRSDEVASKIKSTERICQNCMRTNVWKGS